MSDAVLDDFGPDPEPAATVKPATPRRKPRVDTSRFRIRLAAIVFTLAFAPSSAGWSCSASDAPANRRRQPMPGSRPADDLLDRNGGSRHDLRPRPSMASRATSPTTKPRRRSPQSCPTSASCAQEAPQRQCRLRVDQARDHAAAAKILPSASPASASSEPPLPRRLDGRTSSVPSRRQQGIAGIEKTIDDRWLAALHAGFARGGHSTVRLSIDISVQHPSRRTGQAMERYRAIAAAGIILDVIPARSSPWRHCRTTTQQPVVRSSPTV
jgi:hypothetical protein